jgi:hypothetical protein
MLPTIAPGTEIRADARNCGSADGMRTLSSAVSSEPPFTRITSSACGVAEASPSTILERVADDLQRAALLGDEPGGGVRGGDPDRDVAGQHERVGAVHRAGDQVDLVEAGLGVIALRVGEVLADDSMFLIQDSCTEMSPNWPAVGAAAAEDAGAVAPPPPPQAARARPTAPRPVMRRKSRRLASAVRDNAMGRGPRTRVWRAVLGRPTATIDLGNLSAT